MANDIDSTTLRERLIALRHRRAKEKDAKRGTPRRRLSSTERAAIRRKTGSKCHICGGVVGDDFHADHVLAHSAGGGHAAANYLPSHAVCNNYRWDYGAEEFQLILKLGVWARTQVERGTTVGRSIEERFGRYEKSRVGRQKSASAGRGA